MYEDQVDDTPGSRKNAASQARNVVNGLKILEHVESASNKSYPWDTTLDPADNAPAAAIIDEEVGRMADTLDAVSDLALAEGVYQVVQGHYERAGATLKAVAGGRTKATDAATSSSSARPFSLQSRLSPASKSHSSGTPLPSWSELLPSSMSQRSWCPFS